MRTVKNCIPVLDIKFILDQSFDLIKYPVYPMKDFKPSFWNRSFNRIRN